MPKPASLLLVTHITEMLKRPDFLLPLAAAQRQFRADNYQMGSAALLEDLFFDALGTYLRENSPREKFMRRQGKEPWDYEFFGEKFSHKENTGLTFTANWEPGVKDPVSKKWTPARATYDFPHPIVLVYAGGTGPFSYTVPGLLDGRAKTPRTGALHRLGPAKIGKKAVPTGRLVLARIRGRAVEVDHVWSHEDWPTLDFIELWPVLGGGDLLDKDLWVDRHYAGRHGLHDQAGSISPALTLELDREPWPCGVYVLEASTLTAAPLWANNKGHSVETEFVEKAMQMAFDAGLFVPMPLWFSIFADNTPPNLYAAQRREFEAIFAARRPAKIT